MTDGSERGQAAGSSPAGLRACVDVDDVERAVDLIRSFPWGRIARLADPFAHGLCLLEFRGSR